MDCSSYEFQTVNRKPPVYNKKDSLRITILKKNFSRFISISNSNYLKQHILKKLKRKYLCMPSQDLKNMILKFEKMNL